MGVRALIFDCDGTLVDSEGLATDAFAEEAGTLGLRVDRQEAFHLFRGAKMADCVAILEERFATRLPETFASDVRVRMAALFRQKLQPVRGARELLCGLRVPFCVASSGPRAKIELTLSLTGLRGFFGDRILSSYDLGVWKPDPGIFLHAASTLGVPPEKCAVVEDSPPGIIAGLAAGMRVFFLRADDAGSAVPTGAEPVQSLLDLPALLGAEVWAPRA